jgi:hypothetical protein
LSQVIPQFASTNISRPLQFHPNAGHFGKFDAHFVTAAYLFVDLEKSLLHYSAAAHPPLLLALGTSGKVLEFEENGLMLGMFSESVYLPWKST